MVNARKLKEREIELGEATGSLTALSSIVGELKSGNSSVLRAFQNKLDRAERKNSALTEKIEWLTKAVKVRRLDRTVFPSQPYVSFRLDEPESSFLCQLPYLIILFRRFSIPFFITFAFLTIVSLLTIISVKHFFTDVQGGKSRPHGPRPAAPAPDSAGSGRADPDCLHKGSDPSLPGRRGHDGGAAGQIRRCVRCCTAPELFVF